MTSHRAKHNPYAAEFATGRKSVSVARSEMVRPRKIYVCPTWARGGHCKWGDQCYDLHHGITAYLDEDVESIMLERAASSGIDASDIEVVDVSSINNAALNTDEEASDRMRPLSPGCTLSPRSPVESALNLSISFPIDSVGREQAFSPKMEWNLDVNEVQ